MHCVIDTNISYTGPFIGSAKIERDFANIDRCASKFEIYFIT